MPGPSMNTSCCLCRGIIYAGDQQAKCLVNCRKLGQEWVCNHCKNETVVDHFEANINRWVVELGPGKLCFRDELDRLSDMYRPCY